jgi:hypothetical protein
MRSRVLGAATFFLCLQLLATASADAQGQQPPTPPKTRPSYSSIEHNVITWFHRVTRADTHRHRIASSPPLPRPRPAQLTKSPELPATAVEPKGTQPVSTAVDPNQISPAPAPKVEPDKAPTEPPAVSVEPNELPPAALPLSRMEGPRDLTTPRLSQIGRPGIYRPQQLSRMRRNLPPLPASRIRYPRHQQPNQPRRRLNYRPERLSRLRRRASQRGLCPGEPIFQTDEATTSGRFHADFASKTRARHPGLPRSSCR